MAIRKLHDFIEAQKPLFHFERNEMGLVTQMNRDYNRIHTEYFYEGMSLTTPEKLLPYIDRINGFTDRGLETKNPRIIMFLNFFVNELQCDFVYADHREKMDFVFRGAHQKIDGHSKSWKATQENETIKEIMNKSNYDREHYFDKPFSEIPIPQELLYPKLR